MKSILSFSILLFVLTVNGQNLDSIRIELEQLELASIQLRNQVMPTIKSYGYQSQEMDSLNRAIMLFDSVSLVKVRRIIDQYGWLGKSEGGESANRALYLSIQHAPDSAIREKYFPLLKESVEKGESDLSAMATMYDRMLIQKGQKQYYGTQSRMVNGQQELFPVEDPEELNKRRKKVGLGKLK